MDQQNSAPAYHIWGVDNSPYGPVELPALVAWIKDERVISDTWIFVERENGWMRAAEVPELNLFFKPKSTGDSDAARGTLGNNIEPGALRRIKALAELTDEQLSSLLGFVEVVQVRPFTHLVRKGEPGDAMFGVLEGEVRSCIIVDGKECSLATLGPGGIFGEISLFDKGPHAADVLANQEGTLIKISADAVSTISKEDPEAALALLLGLIKAIAGRVRTLTRRYEDSVHIARRAEPLGSDWLEGARKAEKLGYCCVFCAFWRNCLASYGRVLRQSSPLGQTPARRVGAAERVFQPMAAGR